MDKSLHVLGAKYMRKMYDKYGMAVL